jgi:GntR family transcriptional regulator, transcriptional repressor for pyruvate dehydrogenase complex
VKQALVEPTILKLKDPDDGLEPTTRVSRVIQGVRELIRSEDLRIGDTLPSEAAVGAALGVSRVAVREAFRSMAALGVIDVGNGRRAKVAAVDHGVFALVIDHAVQTDQVSIQQILDVRRTIEMRTVALAATLRTDREARDVAASAAGMRRDFADAEAVMEHDIAFHRAIARASHNPMFATIVDSFHVVTRQTWRIGWQARRSEEDRLRSVACHEAIAGAIAARDRLSAESLMASHFDETVKMLLDSGIN